MNFLIVTMFNKCLVHTAASAAIDGKALVLNLEGSWWVSHMDETLFSSQLEPRSKFHKNS